MVDFRKLENPKHFVLYASLSTRIRKYLQMINTHHLIMVNVHNVTILSSFFKLLDYTLFNMYLFQTIYIWHEVSKKYFKPPLIVPCNKCFF